MRILLVDDDNSISAAVVALLTKQNHYIVDVAADGQDGWEPILLV